jgi:hypothetical protein
MSDHDLPVGWDDNPSSWPQRAPISGLALLGFGIATLQRLRDDGTWSEFSSRSICSSTVQLTLPSR